MLLIISQYSFPSQKKISLQERSTDIAAKILRSKVQCPIQDILTCPRNSQTSFFTTHGKDDKERILIFGQRSLLELMESLDTLWLADGTFKICPEIFFQLFTIHITVNGYNPPCVYILLQNKTERTYDRMLQ